MTDQSTGQTSSHVRYFVRRLDDVRGVWRSRRQYEFAVFPPVGLVPTQVERTSKPEQLLHKAGVHTTDIADYVRNADTAWTGGKGPWRGIFPYETPEDHA